MQRRRGAAGGLAARRTGDPLRTGERLRRIGERLARFTGERLRRSGERLRRPGEREALRRRSGLTPPRRRTGDGLLREELTVAFSAGGALAPRGERERRPEAARPRSSRPRTRRGDGERELAELLLDEERLEPELELEPDDEPLLDELDEAERARRFAGGDFSFLVSTILKNSL